jgi:hypothetical protein
MKAAFAPSDPVPELMDQLLDGLHLLYECRRRGVDQVDRLLDYIEYTMDEIERHRLRTNTTLSPSTLSADETEALLRSERGA